MVRMRGDAEDETVSGQALMSAGVQLAQAFSGTGFTDGMRLFPDFSSRLYFIEAVDEKPEAPRPSLPEHMPPETDGQAGEEQDLFDETALDE